MPVYELRISGGTHTSWAAVCSTINANVPFGDDVTINLQGGQNFSTGGATLGTGGDEEILNLYISTKASERATPATLTGQISLNLTSQFGRTTVIMNNFIHVCDSIPDGEAPIYNRVFFGN